MDNQQALEIIGALATGVDPFTGEVFSDDSIFQNPETVRALFMAARALEDSGDANRPNAADRDRPAAAGKPWSVEEDRWLAAAFDAGQTRKQLTQTHQRTAGAIRSRLVKLGKLEAPADDGGVPT